MVTEAPQRRTTRPNEGFVRAFDANLNNKLTALHEGGVVLTRQIVGLVGAQTLREMNETRQGGVDSGSVRKIIKLGEAEPGKPTEFVRTGNGWFSRKLV